ncbi:MAG TPA: SulP family inorganic anion transporter [Roseiflexaceae bacterium]|nr:SulP family inorganic anion transporter [Roseiflexaceae bacterium]
MRLAPPRLPLLAIYRREFAGYSWDIFRRDLLAGLTVGAVALPLALAFGVASGANAAAGIVTAILAGLVIAGLGGAPFQISGPTGAMSAVLIVLAQRYGLAGIWVACLMAGLFLVLLGVFRLGRYIAFIPSPVIAGFTSGIALIIAIGQIDNVLGVANPHRADNALEKLLHYLRQPPAVDWHSLAIAAIVVVTMVLLPRLTRQIPGSLVGIALASLVATLAGWQAATIGEIPRTILLDERLTWQAIPWGQLNDLLPAAISIAALGAIESLLCGAVGANMTGQPMDANQELIGQGIGNMLIPFFGGVPATAAIARSSVGIKSGGVTRVVSFVHALLLLLSVFALGPLIGRIPLAALGGVLLVTAWRMNEWESIHFFTRARLKHALAGMLVTMLATVALDLTQAILIGLAISALIYLRQSAGAMNVRREPVSLERIRGVGHTLQVPCPQVHVYYLTGSMFFGSVHTVLESFETAREYRTLIISMRGVPVIDVMGAQALMQIVEEQRRHGGDVYFSGVQPAVREMFGRTGLTELVGADHLFWSADQAIVAVHLAHEADGCGHCTRHPEERALSPVT